MFVVLVLWIIIGNWFVINNFLLVKKLDWCLFGFNYGFDIYEGFDV